MFSHSHPPVCSYYQSGNLQDELEVTMRKEVGSLGTTCVWQFQAEGKSNLRASLTSGWEMVDRGFCFDFNWIYSKRVLDPVLVFTSGVTD